MPIDRGGGHPTLPAAAPTGLFTDVPLRFVGAGGRERITLMSITPVPAIGSELVYAVLPVFDDEAENILDGFRSTAVALDVLFDDGSRLLDDDAVDQFGLPAAALPSCEAKALHPDQWNLRRVSLGDQDRTAIAIELVLDPPEPSGSVGVVCGWLDGISVSPTVPLDRTLPPAELVDTRRGSHSSPHLSRGNTAPFVARPHGAVLATPMTDLSNPHWNYSWNAHGTSPRPTLAALAISHSASIWIGDWGVVHFLPITANGEGTHRFDHATERAHPHYYRVDLDEGISAEVTTTDHCVQMRFTFPTGGGAVRMGSFGRSKFRLEDGSISGWVDGTSVHRQSIPRVFTLISSDAPIVELADDLIRFDPSWTQAITLTIGTSLISTVAAARSWQREARGEFVETAADAAAVWNRALGIVAVEGASDDELVTLYSNLYRMLLYPSELHEQDETGAPSHPVIPVEGDADHGSDQTGFSVAEGRLAGNNGFWDTYRTEWPALVLLEPERAAQLIDGFVQQYRDTGWVPRWAAPGPLDAMVGTSFDIVFADAVIKGVADLPLDDGFRAALRDATARPPHPAVGRKALASSLYRGYADRQVVEGLSWTLEGALNDYGLAVMAEALGLPAERRYFASRALAHETLFDRSTGFFRGRNALGDQDGPFDPEQWGGDYTETQAWGMAFSAPHAGRRLAALHGGPDGLRAKLDEFFATPETGRGEVRGTYATVIHEMVEARNLRFGMWAPSNQPAHHIPFMYSFAGAPARTQRVVREALHRLFIGSEIGQGYPGDEDNGEMSAWWFFAALGLYPLAPGSGDYIVCSPLFERMTLTLPGGILDVIAHGQSRKNVYIQSLLIDGEPWSSLAVPHSRIAGGAVLEFLLGPNPSDWGEEPRSHDATRLVDVSAEATSTHPVLIDDRGDEPVSTTRVELVFARPIRPSLYTLTFEHPGEYSWRLEYSTDLRRWEVADERCGEFVQWPQQLRPFEPTSAVEARSWRLVSDGVVLRQIELLIPA